MKARLLALAVPWWVAACSSPLPPAGSAPRDLSPVADVRAHNCGRCHMAPEPKTLSRAQLELAFARHRRRVRLSDDDWGRLVDYLAQGDSR